MRLHREMTNTRCFVTPRDLGYATNVSIANQLVARWTSFVGWVWFDDRRSGGHTREFATRSLLLDAVHKILKNESIPISSYKWKRKYRPYGYRKGSYLRSRRLLGRVKRVIASNEVPLHD